MATAKNQKKSEQKEAPPWANEVQGIILLGFGALLMLSLLSYSPRDLPLTDWKWFANFATDAEPHLPRTNWIGPVGAILGLSTLQICGAAAYLVPPVLLLLGFAKIFQEQATSWRNWLGGGIFVISAAAFLGVQDWILTDWADKMIIIGPGGLLGDLLGQKVLVALLNKAGAIIVLLCIYLVSLILVTGIHPMTFISHCIRSLKAWWKQRSEEQVKRAKERHEARRREREKEKLKRERQREGNNSDSLELDISAEEKPKKKRASRKKAKTKPAETSADESPQPELPLKTTPPPQIIDASQRKKTPAAKPGDKLFDKKPAVGGLNTDGYEGYELPGFDLLNIDDVEEEEPEADKGELLAVQSKIVETLKAFGVEVSPGDITRGPTITRYEVYPSLGLRVSRITQLEADIARATCAERINILAPIPGKDTVGIEIANNKAVAVPLHELLQDKSFASAKNRIPLALGKDVYGNTVIGDLAAMPHLLVAGATGSGKSVCINSIITSILYKFSPDELRFIMVDPKVVEMQMYNSLPHLAVPVVTDPAKVVAALRWVVNEMENRYKIFAKVGVRNFDSFNKRPIEKEPEPEEVETPAEPEEEPDMEHIDSIVSALTDGELGPEAVDPEFDEFALEIPDRIPYIVIIIDELADLMQTAPADVEMNIARIAQKARAAGIHLIVATQTPRADVVTGIIKANIPSRIAFQVSSKLDSRVILDVGGADKLVGKGDMLYLPPGSAKLERAQGAFVSDEEVERIVDFCSNQVDQKFEKAVQESIESGGGSDDEENAVSDADEETIKKCLEVIYQEQKASTSLLQRRLRLGYTRAARMMDILEQRGIIGPQDGAKPRDILIHDAK
ncbi:FtsK/SpoIIIE family DNA translocase [Persicirhabdus sediminis]|uniref:DNA translocase FtsK 4TM domain-containing protein n=1 Tax=Persicirhabdus sediminis TaxID=454144 RepID=A0A8J7MGC9_9BACT|nr:DNA translocase FtsK [Persicirhabdus sediminis]MBK1792537.1 DNA translocase FtsK 4TM domain-containing protein [Persicirhabdus sediminis]